MDAETQALIDRLLARIAELEAVNQALHQLFDDSQKCVAALEARLEELERANARQAAPFRRRERKRSRRARRKNRAGPRGIPVRSGRFPSRSTSGLTCPWRLVPSAGVPSPTSCR